MREIEFLRAWRNISDPPIWFKAVRDATYDEDIRKHTDAHIDAEDRSIPIQIKSSNEDKQTFDLFYGKDSPNIVVVVLPLGAIDEEIIRRTLLAIYAKHPDLLQREVRRRKSMRRAFRHRLRSQQIPPPAEPELGQRISGGL